MVTYQITAQAGSISWVAGGELKLLDNSERSMNLTPQKCREQTVSINDRAGLTYYESGSTNACVYDRGSWRYALTNQTYRRWPMDQRDVSFALSVGSDAKMYRVDNLHPQDIPVDVPGSKGLVYVNGSIAWGGILTIYKDIVKRLEKVDSNSYTVKNFDSPDFKFQRPNGTALSVGKAASSDNGKWLVFEAVNLGIMRLNLETYEIKRVSSVAPQYGLWGTPHMSLAISDNGEYLAIAGVNTPFKIYHVTTECGDTAITDELTKDVPVVSPCPERDIGQYLETVLPSGLAAATSIRLSADAGEIGFIASLNNSQLGQNMKEYVVQSPGYVPSSRLDYLAMGDSFSSGEGDTEVGLNGKYYLPGTDVAGDDKTPEEKCHISSRSYPFLLKEAMGIVDGSMESVACSGAELRDDYTTTQDLTDYNGQGNRLAGYEKDIDIFKARALEAFVPGRLQQLEFIKTYQPRSITLTASGNDVGFGSVIKSCILSNMYACNYNATQAGRAMIGQGIALQHHELTKLFAEIRDISPSTKIYMVGYPQFINETSFFCAPNVPLSQAERTLITESVTYLNRVIKSAADSSGVKYVDIEDALKGHRLCESGTSYVTGLALARSLGFGTSLIGRSEMQESFHPNRNGHALIAGAIKKELDSQSLLDYTDYPTTTGYQSLARPVDPPAYFAESMRSTTKQYKKRSITLREFVQKVPVLNMINIRFGGFEPLSQIRVEIHSEPVDLGAYHADESGSLSVDVSLPMHVPAGFHTLHLIGTSYSGEEIDIWQSIEVRGEVGDIDEDGVFDDIDQCIYVAESDVDEDEDGVDDACDPMIEFDNLERTEHIAGLTGDGHRNNLVVEQAANNVNRASGNIVNFDNSVKDIFYLPNRSDDSRSVVNRPVDHTYLMIGVIISSFILYWAITRYSNHNDT